jgi:hypothetical protein
MTGAMLIMAIGYAESEPLQVGYQRSVRYPVPQMPAFRMTMYKRINSGDNARMHREARRFRAEGLRRGRSEACPGSTIPWLYPAIWVVNRPGILGGSNS